MGEHLDFLPNPLGLNHWKSIYCTHYFAFHPSFHRLLLLSQHSQPIEVQTLIKLPSAWGADKGAGDSHLIQYYPFENMLVVGDKYIIIINYPISLVQQDEVGPSFFKTCFLCGSPANSTPQKKAWPKAMPETRHAQRRRSEKLAELNCWEFTGLM